MKIEFFTYDSSYHYILAGKTFCGATTKSTGRPCRIKEIYSNGRCRYHGGLSTGPKTKEGKKRSAQNGFKKGWKSKQPSAIVLDVDTVGSVSKNQE